MPFLRAKNPDEARFCNACGTTLGQAEQRRKERKFATALFADLVGSTALAEQEDPEVVQSVVGRTFDRLFIPLTEANLALVRGANAEAAARFVEVVRRAPEINVDSFPEVFPDTVRALLRAGRAPEADGFPDLSEQGRSPAARADATLVEGLLSDDPAKQRRRLAEAIAELERLGLRIDAARARVDLARAMARAGEDPRPMLERAREILIECDARGFLFEVDDAVADLAR